MDDKQSEQQNPYGRVAKIISVGCGAIGGMFFCGIAGIFPMLLLSALNFDAAWLESIPFTFEQIAGFAVVLLVIIGVVLGGGIGYLLFYRIAFKGGERRAIAQQQAFNQAVEEVVEKELDKRGIE